MSARKLESERKRELIVEMWQQLGRPKIGASELQKIQNHLSEEFGGLATESPALIARMLADEGAELRHPEVIEFDVRWREGQIADAAKHLSDIDFTEASTPLTLERAEQLIKHLEEMRKKFDHAGDEAFAERIRITAIEARKMARLAADRRIANETRRAEQLEIAEWLGVWLKTPNLFDDWLDLRRRSADFRKKFSTQSRHEP